MPLNRPGQPTPKFEVIQLCKEDELPFEDWFKSLSKPQRTEVVERLQEAQSGIMGRTHPMKKRWKGKPNVGGLEEFVFSSSVRIYYGVDPDEGLLFVRVVLLHGSTDKSQKAQEKEVQHAAYLWSDYLEDPKVRRRSVDVAALSEY